MSEPGLSLRLNVRPLPLLVSILIHAVLIGLVALLLRRFLRPDEKEVEILPIDVEMVAPEPEKVEEAEKMQGEDALPTKEVSAAPSPPIEHSPRPSNVSAAPPPPNPPTPPEAIVGGEGAAETQEAPQPSKIDTPPTPPPTPPPPPPPPPTLAPPAPSPVVTTAPSPLLSVRPKYPRRARRHGIEGTVVVSLIIAADGTIRDAKVQSSSGSPDLDEAALDAARKTTFRPGTRDGLATDVETTLPFVFRLRD